MATKKTTQSSAGFPGCAVSAAGRKAVGVHPVIKTSSLRRLSRIEGQMRGIQRMVEEDRYCADILMPVSSAQEAHLAVARSLRRNHLAHCAAMRSGPDRMMRNKLYRTSCWT